MVPDRDAIGAHGGQDHLRRDLLTASREQGALVAQPEQRPAVAVGAGHHPQQARVAGEDGGDARAPVVAVPPPVATPAAAPNGLAVASASAHRDGGGAGATGSGAGPNQRQPQCASTTAASAIAASSATSAPIRHGHDAGGVVDVIGTARGLASPVAYNRVASLPTFLPP